MPLPGIGRATGLSEALHGTAPYLLAGLRAKWRSRWCGGQAGTAGLCTAAGAGWAAAAERRVPQPCGGSNAEVRRMPAARPLPAITRAILRDASSIISSPSMAAPFAPPASEVYQS
jgi:hypothetical protein